MQFISASSSEAPPPAAQIIYEGLRRRRSHAFVSLPLPQILPSGDLVKGPGGFFNATLTLDAAAADEDGDGGGGLLGRYICLANNNRGHDHKEVFVVDGGEGGGDSALAAGGDFGGAAERGK